MKKPIIVICFIIALLLFAYFALSNPLSLYLKVLQKKERTIADTRFSTLTKALSTAPHLAEFKRLFPRSSLNYKYFANSGDPGINVETVVEGRYYLTMQIPVSFSENNKTIEFFGDPAFLLNEIANIESEFGELQGLSYGTNFKFGQTEWEKIVSTNGNFYSGGINIHKNDPIEGIDVVYKYIDEKMFTTNANITSEWKPKP